MEIASQMLHESSSSSSFSYAWLHTTSNKPSNIDTTTTLGHSFNAHDATTYIEMDPDVFSMRWPSSYNSSHDFTLPCAQSVDFAPADELFFDGMVATSQIDSSKSSFERSGSIDSSKSYLSHRNECVLTDLPRPMSVNSSPLFYSAQSTPFLTGRRSGKVQRKSPLMSMRSCTESSKKLLVRYMCFLLPLYKKVKQMQLFARKSSCRKPTTTLAAAASAGPSRRTSLSSVEWCHGNADTAVYDAILYCKRSIGQEL